MSEGGEDDSDKTVFGAALPRSPHGQKAARPVAPTPPPTVEDEPTIVSRLPGAPPGKADPPRDGQTVIGGALPPMSSAPATPPLSRRPAQRAEHGKTIVGGPLPKSVASPLQMPTPPGVELRPAGLATPPQLPPQHRGPPVAPPPIRPAVADLSATDFLSAQISLTSANTANPFIAAGAPLLSLLGRLRTGEAKMSTVQFYEHALQEIATFDHNLQSLGVDQHDALVAKYVLCATVDDVVQNLPDIAPQAWAGQSLVVRLFNQPDARAGFFKEAQKAIQSPATRYHVLEFMLVCLNLGFEGQYRGQPGGVADLNSIRSAIHSALRRTRPLSGRHQSLTWEPVTLRGRGPFKGVPIWAMTAIALLALVAFFGTLMTVLNRNGTAVSESLYALHPAQTPITLERAPGPVFIAPVRQFDRVSDGLNGDVLAGRLELSQLGNYIVIRVGNANMFASGSAVVNPDFAPLAGRIAAVLDAEQGPLTVVGYTDSSGAFNTNLQLSVERADAVAELLKAGLQDPFRVAVEGRGETEPIADNSTETGRAKNRRVEIKLAREGTF